MRTFLSILISFFTFLVSSSLFGFDLYRSEDFSFELKGYYKNLYVTSKSQATDEPFHTDLNRIRTEWDANFWKILSAKIVWDNELIAGDFVNTAEFDRRQAERNDPYLDMDYELIHQEDFYYGQSFYRAWAKVDPGFFNLTVGRQKIDWGVMRLFSPVDLFTRLPIFDIEKDERVGTTGANLIVPIGSNLRINPVYAFNTDFDRSRIAGRVTQTIGHFDLSALGGKVLEDEVYGFDFSGDIRKAGVRGELIYDRAEFGDDFIQGSVGVDYGFENTFYFALEYFYNGQGTNNPATILPFPPTGVQIQSVHKNFIGLNLKYDLTPLWIATMMTVVDVNGGSVFLYPVTEYSLLDWVEISVGAQIPVGKSRGEFTAIPNAFFAQTQLFF